MKDNTLNKLRTRLNRYRGRWMQIVFLLILLSWAIFIYSRDNPFLGSLVLLFLLLVVLRVPYLLPVMALALVLVLFQTPLEKTWSAIIQSNRSVLENPGQAFTNLFTPGSGLTNLPGPARRAISLLQSNDIDQYQLSSQVLDDPLISQRIIEGAWPRKIDGSSPYHITFLNEERDLPACTIIDKKVDVALEHCP